jgi:hypothetical protein
VREKFRSFTKSCVPLPWLRRKGPTNTRSATVGCPRRCVPRSKLREKSKPVQRSCHQSFGAEPVCLLHRPNVMTKACPVEEREPHSCAGESGCRGSRRVQLRPGTSPPHGLRNRAPVEVAHNSTHEYHRGSQGSRFVSFVPSDFSIPPMTLK